MPRLALRLPMLCTVLQLSRGFTLHHHHHLIRPLAPLLTKQQQQVHSCESSSRSSRAHSVGRFHSSSSSTSSSRTRASALLAAQKDEGNGDSGTAPASPSSETGRHPPAGDGPVAAEAAEAAAAEAAAAAAAAAARPGSAEKKTRPSVDAAKGNTLGAARDAAYPRPTAHEVSQVVNSMERPNGVMAVYKPKGWTSSDVVSKIKGELQRGLSNAALKRLDELYPRAPAEIQQEEERQRMLAKGDELLFGKVSPIPDDNADKSTIVADAIVRPKGGRGRRRGGGKKTQPGQQKGGDVRRGPRFKVKVGHGGTLDPMATGVLVIGVGSGTKSMGGMLKGAKAYEACGLLGVETDTLDTEGKVIGERDASHVTWAALKEAVKPFRGDIMQVPPMYSALKRKGKKLYELAREGITVEREARPVHIARLDVREAGPPLSSSMASQLSDVTPVPPPELPHFGLSIECGGGTYVRSLIDDIARSLDTRGIMTALERTQQGPFGLHDCLRQEFWSYRDIKEHLDTNRPIADAAAAAAAAADASEAATGAAVGGGGGGGAGAAGAAAAAAARGGGAGGSSPEDKALEAAFRNAAASAKAMKVRHGKDKKRPQ